MIVRHPVRGLLGGLLLGIGLALVMVQLGFVPFAEWTVLVVIVAGVLLGLAFALVMPAPAVATAPPPARVQTPAAPAPSAPAPPTEAPPADAPPVPPSDTTVIERPPDDRQ
jgi:hypothetical protein